MKLTERILEFKPVTAAEWPAIICSGEVPGLLGYLGNEPSGRRSVAPREAFPVLDRSPVLKRVDDQPVGSSVTPLSG